MKLQALTGSSTAPIESLELPTGALRAKNNNLQNYTDHDNKEDINIFNDVLFNDIDNKVNKNNDNGNICIYCDAVFSKNSNLQRHLNNICKSKKNYDEMEKLKQRFENIINEFEKLKKENEELKNNKKDNINKTANNQINNGTINNNKSINNGIINNNNIINNNLNVQLVQFGNENIDDIDIKEALEVYFKSTGGNILSNMLKYVNLNEKYPENHNICMSDLSRELVKIFNGKHFVVKKFKNVKGDIICKVIKNTYKIVDKIENDKNIKLNNNTKTKLKINKVSLQLIDGKSAEDIVREEIREKEKVLILTNKDNESINEKKERDFNLEERLKIEHLESKKFGLQEISYERLKEELYNAKYLMN